MSLKPERHRLRGFRESTLCWKMFFSLIKLLISGNLTLRRHNASSVVSSSPQREPENASNKLESGAGSQHKWVCAIWFFSEKGWYCESERRKNVILNWFKLCEKPHARAQPTRGSINKACNQMYCGSRA